MCLLMGTKQLVTMKKTKLADLIITSEIFSSVKIYGGQSTELSSLCTIQGRSVHEFCPACVIKFNVLVGNISQEIKTVFSFWIMICEYFNIYACFHY